MFRLIKDLDRDVKLIIYEYYPMLAAHNYRMSKSSNYKIKKSN